MRKYWPKPSQVNTRFSSLISGVKWLGRLWPSSFTSCRRHLLLWLVPLPMCSFLKKYPMAVASATSLGLQCKPWLPFHNFTKWPLRASVQRSPPPPQHALHDLRGSLKLQSRNPRPFTCDLCIFHDSKASTRRITFMFPALATSLGWTLTLLNYIFSSFCLLFCSKSRKLLGPFLSQIGSLVEFGAVLRASLSFAPTQPGFS